jgi:hypothetical protein
MVKIGDTRFAKLRGKLGATVERPGPEFRSKTGDRGAFSGPGITDERAARIEIP